MIGKPLALVNIGDGLELAGSDNNNWSTINSQRPHLYVLQPDGTPLPPNASGYISPIKLRDVDRTFNGMVGYFDSTAGATGSLGSTPTSDLDLSSISTYYPSTATTPPAEDPRVCISASANNFSLITPYFNSAGEAADSVINQAANMQVFGATMGPFLPIHATAS